MGGWLFLGDIITARQASGMALAVVGMVAYGVATSQCVPHADSAECDANAWIRVDRLHNYRPSPSLQAYQSYHQA